jgi:hypothetical protein
MAKIDNPLQELLTERDVARLLRVSVATIRRRRLLHQPPTWKKVGAAVRYEMRSVSDFLESCPTGGGHQAEAE